MEEQKIVDVRIVGSDNWFSKEVTWSDTIVHEVLFNFTANHVIVENNSTNDIRFSFDGTNYWDTLNRGDIATLDGKRASRIYVQLTVSSDTVKIRAW